MSQITCFESKQSYLFTPALYCFCAPTTLLPVPSSVYCIVTSTRICWFFLFSVSSVVSSFATSSPVSSVVFLLLPFSSLGFSVYSFFSFSTASPFIRRTSSSLCVSASNKQHQVVESCIHLKKDVTPGSQHVIRALLENYRGAEANHEKFSYYFVFHSFFFLHLWFWGFLS